MDQESKKDPKGESSTASEKSGTDVVLIHGTTADGKGLAVLRQREDKLERGLVMPIEQGKPIVGEVVTLQPRPDFPLLCDVKVEYDPATPTSSEVPKRLLAKGPGQVATDVYRTNWERIFQSRPESGSDLN